MPEAISSSLPLLAIYTSRSPPPVAEVPIQRCLGWVSQCLCPLIHQHPGAQQSLPCETQSIRHSQSTYNASSVPPNTLGASPLGGAGLYMLIRTLNNPFCWECCDHSGVRHGPGTLSFDTKALSWCIIPFCPGICWFEPSKVKPQLERVTPHFPGKCFNNWVLCKRWTPGTPVITFKKEWPCFDFERDLIFTGWWSLAWHKKWSKTLRGLSWCPR